MSQISDVREWISRVKDHRYVDALDAQLARLEQAELDLASLEAEVKKQEQKLRDLQASVVTKEGKLANLDATIAAKIEQLAKQVAYLDALMKVNG